ncbi:hypothetical protein ACP70R_004447 [Stipagrostis hirtigluma subsp. patula]
MAKRRQRSDDDGQSHRRTEKRRRRLHLLVNDCNRGFSMYKVNVDDFDTDDSDSDAEDDIDSKAQRLRRRRMVVRLAGGGCQSFLAVGTKIFDLYPSSSDHRANVVFDTTTRLVTTTPPFQAPKKLAEFWAVGRTIYALECIPAHRHFREGSEPGCFERLGREPRPGYGTWRWEALPSPPFKLGAVVSLAVHPDCATVFLSVHKTGTFSFDGERLAWERHGGWLLPFAGEAHYVRELDAWVGLSSRQRGRIAACQVVDVGRRHGAEPTCKSGKDWLYSKSNRHLDANLTYMGNAEFCLQETLTREGDDADTTFGLKVLMLLRAVTFRVEYSGDGELCAVNRRARIFKLPRHSSERRPFAFWI